VFSEALKEGIRNLKNTNYQRLSHTRLLSSILLFLLTAVAWAAVDGRQPGVSVGMSLFMLSDLLLELGAIDAMNLDGGGSTTMVIQNKLVNKPSDQTGERPVSDAILVFPRDN
jgi:hypothetical protein